jgi:hypothetical protein
MTYFSKFPLLGYTVDSGVTTNIVSDILRRISVNTQTKENFSLYEEYTVQDGETPETVSFKFYNDAQYHWVILMLNDIIDPRFDWPLTETQLYDYAVTKYGTANISLTKYYTISSEDDTVVDPTQKTYKKAVNEFGVTYDDGFDYTYPSTYAVTNIAHESKLNEGKRNIRVLRPKFLSAFVSEFEALING